MRKNTIGAILCFGGKILKITIKWNADDVDELIFADIFLQRR